ncbi:glycosyltransferase [Flavobacterium sp. HSC-61S13]|uniref:glycosyltransferase n=1 Tax=Flavobacterium sp. HSC-61S13 TaxID=2910963 RepID=UPI0020A00A74|nr:hypothetical protein [Flavobacterium sp. HSC-61S13]MCP1997428.1 glycosyltransferase involved in cell wall biosynthesis [Flavobacterium sp. HSC-61S13]
MSDKHILIFEYDIQKYPPILSIINFLQNNGLDIIVIGCCYDLIYIESLKKKGVTFYNLIDNNTQSNSIVKFLRLIFFRKKVQKILKSYSQESPTVWLFGQTSIWLFYRLINNFKTNLYLFEFPRLEVSLRYRLLSPFINYKKALQNAKNVICCEYNRSHITKSFFNLQRLPHIIPNKPIMDIAIDGSLEDDSRFTGKKIILYQGIFNYPERRMDELCEAIAFLPDEYIVCLMGSDNDYKNTLKTKYENNDRIVFLPFVASPSHLKITQKAHIGFLTYFSDGGKIEHSLNTLYCAPNKIYEYANFGIPMLSNDIPALNYLFEKHKCGISVEGFTPERIAKVITDIDANYSLYSDGSKALFNATNIDDKLKEIIL